MLSLRTNLNSICAELRSDKVTTRNKAADCLDNLLIASKSEIISLFLEDSPNISGADVFSSALEATLKHAAKIHDSKDDKSAQTLRNKNYIYTNIITKLIDYSLEDQNNYLSKTIILNAFTEAFDTRCVVVNFGLLFLDVLERGIYKSPAFVRELKINEYSRILSYLFEVNVGNDDVLRFTILRVINKTIELAVENVQISSDLISYLPEVVSYAKRAKNDNRKSEVIKLFYLFISQLSIDYHETISSSLQEQLPLLLNSFYDAEMRPETKDLLFKSIYLSLRVLFPHVIDNEMNSIIVTNIPNEWSTRILNRIKSIIDMEMKKRSLSYSRLNQGMESKFFNSFVNMASLSIYLIRWEANSSDNNNSRTSANTEDIEPVCSKQTKPSDNIEEFLGLIQQQEKGNINEGWLAVLANLIADHPNVVNSTNILQILQSCARYLAASPSAGVFLCCRRILTVLLKCENHMICGKLLSKDYCQVIWVKLIKTLTSDASLDAEIVLEKETLLQILIHDGKVNLELCSNLLHNYFNSPIMKRNECLKTVQAMLINAEKCGINKTSELTVNIIKWIYDKGESLNAKRIIHNIAPLDLELIADISAIASISFLNKHTEHKNTEECEKIDDLNILLYKKNKKLLCLQEHAEYLKRERIKLTSKNSNQLDKDKQNCLFQSNYELVLRSLNFETSKQSNICDILSDMNSLLRISLVMKSYLDYGIFNEENFQQCPLIKRIGFFLNHLEFQVKNCPVRIVERCKLVEFLEILKKIFNIFTTNENLLLYINTQSLKGTVHFLGFVLKFSVQQSKSSDFDDWSVVSSLCLKNLVHFCASANYSNSCFEHIQSYEFNLETELFLLLDIIEIICMSNNVDEAIGGWFVDFLKLAFKSFYMHTDFVRRITQLMPAILTYLQNFEDCLDNMLVALRSLLSISFKKSYSDELTAYLLNSVRLIMRNNSALYMTLGFRNICISAVKFLKFPSLEVQLAAIKTLIACMDVNYMKAEIENWDEYYDFCDDLYSNIAFKEFSTASPDLEENSKAITVQILIALFAFSCFHKEIALRELVYFCAKQKIRGDFNLMQQIATFYEIPLKDLTDPFVSNLIHFWASKEYPISKFPYFLCCAEADDFFNNNLSEITTKILLYGKPDDFKFLTKYKDKKKLLELCAPQINTFSILHEIYIPHLLPEEFDACMRRAKHNLLELKAGIPLCKGISEVNWKTLYVLVNLLKDEDHYQNLFKHSIFYQESTWLQINVNILKSSLNLYINDDVNEQNKFVCLKALFVEKPIVLTQFFGELKRNCITCAFPMEKAKYFHMYCLIADLVFESILSIAKNQVARLSGSIHFFLIDVISFTLQYAKCVQIKELKKGAIEFLHHLISNKAATSHLRALSSEAIMYCSNDICTTLVTAIEENSACIEFKQTCFHLINFLLKHNQEKDPRNTALLDILPMTDDFVELRDSSQDTLDGGSSQMDFQMTLKRFLACKNRVASGFKSLQRDISMNKYQLESLNDSIFLTIKDLIEYVRNIDNLELAMEASKCLGEIGSVKIRGRTYFFETDMDFYGHKNSGIEAMQAYTQCIANVLDKIIFSFNPKSYKAMNDVIQQVVNSSYGSTLKESISYFRVFLTSSTQTNCLDTFSYCASIDWIQILKSSSNAQNYEQWICEFVSKIYEKCGWNSFKELSLENVNFADASFESLFNLWINGEQQWLEKLFGLLEYFFAEVFTAITSENSSNLIYKDKRVVKKFLNICESIRINNEWNISINLLHVAKACNYCQAYFMSIMYLELWCLNLHNKEHKKINEIKSDEMFQELALKAYDSIGCIDAIAGFLSPIKSRLQYLNLNNNWSDLMLEATPNDDVIENELYTSILKRNGMIALAGLQNKNNNEKQNHQNASKIDYEVCWRLCQWDITVDDHSKINDLNDMENEYEKHHFNALKCFYNREQNNTLAAVQNARQCIVSILKEISIECLQSIYKYLSWLNCLQQIEDLCVIQFPSSIAINEVFEKWTDEKKLEFGNFQCKERLLSHQIALFQTAGVRATRKIKEYFKNDPIETCLLHLIEECKIAGAANLAKRNVAILRNFNCPNVLIKSKVLLEDADISLKTGEFTIANSILDYLLKTKELQSINNVSALRMHGEYFLETNSEGFERIRSKYFSNAFTLLDSYAKAKPNIIEQSEGFFDSTSFDQFISDNRKSVYKVIAKYADREYTQINTYINSDEYHKRLKIIEISRKTSDSAGKQIRDYDKNIGAVLLKKTANLDESEIKPYEMLRTENLCIAIEHYIKFCEIDETTSESTIYRIIALWFSNKQDEKVQEKIELNVNKLPSYKFICALNQITARLDSKNTNFIKVLKALLVRCIQEHPHQTLYKMFPLIFAFHDGSTNRVNDRTEIAREIISKAKNKSNATAIRQYESMFPALIDFANAAVKNQSDKGIPIAESLKKIRNLDAVQCPTIDLPVRPDLNYEIITISKWEDYASLVGGINAPKKLTCICSDGKKRSQLLKGKDDLRQDAVMQQVFALINNILKSDSEAKKRDLLLRTYKVTPLSMRTGILEWCVNTVPIGVYLGSAYKRYRPKDFTIKKCRLIASEHLKSPADKRLQIFTEICRHTHPVMHYFLLENFLVPGIWFERRLAYTNSVATTSIVGYILGLGDRHTHNILIDEKTAEVVHIDFGIAFEQGRVMPTPETVPFRLTRNVVSPMGICETNGIFKKSCEVTMSILRNHSDVITTILEVLLYDPLYIWKVLQQKNAVDNASNSTEEINLTAQRALLTVQNKLEGKQSGILGTSNVEVQVQRLINEAISSRNLCLLYPGWDAYL